MIDSRRIEDLRADVAANCRILIERAAAEGLSVLITSTLRDNEYQSALYAQGRTAKGSIVTNSKTVSFHGPPGLAFDFCKNVKGNEYDDAAFFRRVGELAEEIGFTWGGRWVNFPDSPHIQWDEHGKYTNSMVRAGKYPAEMPRAEEDEVRYKYLKDIPEMFRPTIEALMNADIIGGDGSDPTGNGDVIDLSHDQVRTLVFAYRGGAFDRQLGAHGLPTAVK